MVKHGIAPFLECSSKGDGRFSAFLARLRAYNGKSIEEIYQAAKVFEDGSTGLHWRKAKGKKCINPDQVRKLYSELWDQYLAENPDLMPILTSATGLSDLFGQAGHACQATELWRIRNDYIERENDVMMNRSKFAVAPTVESGFAGKFIAGPYDEFPIDDFQDGAYIFELTESSPKIAIDHMNSVARDQSQSLTDQAKRVLATCRNYPQPAEKTPLDAILGYEFSERIVEHAGRNDDLAEDFKSQNKLDAPLTLEQTSEIIKSIDELMLDYIDDMKYSGDDALVSRDVAGWRQLRLQIWNLTTDADKNQTADIQKIAPVEAPKERASSAKFSFSRPRG